MRNAAALVLVYTGVSLASAQCDPIELSCFAGTDCGVSAGGEVGTDVAVAGVWAIAGAPQYDAPGGGPAPEGGAYLYKKTGSTWPPGPCPFTEQGLIIADDATSGQWFGFAVAMDSVAVVGAPAVSGGAPAAYVFTTNGFTWTQAAKLTPSTGAETLFGRGVAVENTTIVVSSATAIYVYERPPNGWNDMTETARLTSSAVGETFSRVAIDASTVVALAHFPQESVHVFSKPGGGWFDTTETAVLESGYPQYELKDVDIYVDWVVAGGFEDDSNGLGFVWKRDGLWADHSAPDAELTTAYPTPNQRFGQAVAINHEAILVAASETGYTGDAHVYIRIPGCADGWVDATESAVASGGRAIDIDAAGTVIGGHTDPQPPPESPLGGLVSFRRVADCNDDGVEDSCGHLIFEAVAWEGHDSLTILNDITAVAVDQGFSIGSILSYDGANWVETAQLTPSNPDPEDAFGAAVGADCLIVMGAPNHDDGEVDTGGAYIYAPGSGGWQTASETAMLYPPDRVHSMHFGYDIAVSNNRVLIGTDVDPNGELGLGVAYLYEEPPGGWAGGEPVAIPLTPSEGEYGEGFGRVVALQGDVAVVGAPWAFRGATQEGAAYVYRRTGPGVWTEEAHLALWSGDSFAHFGETIAVYDNRVIIGAPNANGVGEVRLYEYDGGFWNEIFMFEACDMNGADNYGAALALSDDFVLIGASGYDGGTGATYGFLREPGTNTWTWVNTTINPDGGQETGFGGGVSLAGGTVIVNSVWSGDAHAVFGLSDCNQNGIVDATDIAVGLSADGNGNGVPDECEACPVDLDGDGQVGFTDLVMVLSAWGPCDGLPCAGDLDASGDVGFGDLIIVLSSWGPCA